MMNAGIPGIATAALPRRLAMTVSRIFAMSSELSLRGGSKADEAIPGIPANGLIMGGGYRVCRGNAPPFRQCCIVFSAEPFLNHSSCEAVNVCLRASKVVVPSACVTWHVTGLPGIRSERPVNDTRSPSRILS